MTLTAGVTVDIDTAATVRSDDGGILLQPDNDADTVVGVQQIAQADMFAIGREDLARACSRPTQRSPLDGPPAPARSKSESPTSTAARYHPDRLRPGDPRQPGPGGGVDADGRARPPPLHGDRHNLSLQSTGAITVNERIEADGGTISFTGASLAATFNGDGGGDTGEAIDAGARHDRDSHDRRHQHRTQYGRADFVQVFPRRSSVASSRAPIRSAATRPGRCRSATSRSPRASAISRCGAAHPSRAWVP